MWTMIAVLRKTGELGLLSLHTDSPAANLFAPARGLGRMRHLEVKSLCVQECMRQGKVVVRKVLGTEKVADVLTKYHGKESLERRLLAEQGVVSGQRARRVLAEGGGGGCSHL